MDRIIGSFRGNRLALITALFALALAGCSTIYYSVWEKLGWEKRDLLRDGIEEVREDQQEVSEQFESALEQIKALYGMDESDLSRQYDKLKNELERSESKAESLSGRIDDVEEIADDLFEEWREEADQISDRQLRSRSLKQLADTESKFRELHRSMNRSEASIEPVLTRLRDQVLFLKHSLNAQAIGSIELEVDRIEADVDRLVKDLERSIAQADEFIDNLPE